MAVMNRNHNLEEISSDAFLGIELLKYQSIPQKIVLFGCLILGVGINIWGSFSGALDLTATVFITAIPIAIGVLFGCNYNEDLSLIQFLKLSFSNPAQILYSKSTEELEYLRSSAERIRQDELRKNQTVEQEEEEHRKLLYKLLLVAGIFVVVIVILLLVVSGSKTEEIHHTVSVMSVVRDV